MDAKSTYKNSAFDAIGFYCTATFKVTIPMGTAPPRATSKKRFVVKALLVVAGTICLALAAVGLVLPLIPTTPFLLLAAACYVRSSERMYRWLLNNRWFGQYIRHYREGKGIPLKTKILAISVLWAVILYSTIFVVDGMLHAELALIAKVTMLGVALGVSIHLIRLPTFRDNQPNKV
jgi:uncharacterized protein